jgi:hypothetical protein
MSEIFISGKAALANFMGNRVANINEALDSRKINASGKLRRTNAYAVDDGPTFTVATLYAQSYWVQAGSGSPPGTKVSLPDLVQWAKDKGLVNNERAALRLAFLTQRKILKEGSRDFRQGNDNVYLKEIDAAQVEIPDVLQTFLRDIDTPLAQQFGKAFQRA